MYHIEAINKQNRAKALEVLQEEWGDTTLLVSRNQEHDIRKLPGFIAIEDHKVVGIVTYKLENNEIEIITLNAFKENEGIGTSLLETVIDKGKELDCSRVWLITTNDNVNAMRFYQLKGFDMVAFHEDAVNKARELKPEIPEIGYHGIKVEHEIEFEYPL
ncbi:MAG: GNAT family N-acetyltransferase [Halanaerobiales bacterium]|nr:GNAT family N-acetyltransferase [Halanaerobiales bacterium]